MGNQVEPSQGTPEIELSTVTSQETSEIEIIVASDKDSQYVVQIILVYLHKVLLSLLS